MSIAKTSEISSYPENEYTDKGQLIGHIVLGYEMVKEFESPLQLLAQFKKDLLMIKNDCLIKHFLYNFLKTFDIQYH